MARESLGTPALVVREGLPGGTRVTSVFSQKPGFRAF